jgi:lysophospholipase L1-like esterase
MEIAGAEPLMVFINVHVPRSWEATSNRELAAGVDRHDNAALVDWYEATDGRNNLFARDGFHPKQPGRVIMAELIAAEIFPDWEPLIED